MSRPVVYLWGERVADSWTRLADNGVLALSDITMPWGRSSIFDPLAPHVATIRMLDVSRNADRYVANTLLGARLEVKREGDGDPIMVWRGRVSEQAAREVTVVDPRTGMPRRVLELTLTVTDVQGVLSTFVRRGDYDGLQLYGTGGVPTDVVSGPWVRGGWDAKYIGDRMAEILARDVAWTGTATVPAGTRPLPDHDLVIGTTAPRAQVRGVAASDLDDLWTLMHQIYASGQGLGWPRLQPGVGVSQGMPQTAAHITLATQLGELVLTTTMAQIPARLLQLQDADAFPIASGKDAVETVNVEIERHQYRWQTELRDQSGATIREAQLLDDDESTTVQVRAGGERGAARDLTLPLGASATVIRPYNTAGAEYNPATNTNAERGWNYAIAIAIEAAERARSLNAWLAMPPLTYSPPEDGDEIPELLQTWDGDAVWLAGSKWATVARAPRTVQIIGGTLAYQDGRWRHELTVAPTIDTTPRDISLDELLGAVNTPISAFASSVTLHHLSAASRSTAT